MIVAKSTPFVMYEMTDPEEIAKADAQRKRFEANVEWLEARIDSIYAENRGKCICVAGQELFVADNGPDVVALARSAHPNDDGLVLRYVPREKMVRVYAHSRTLG
jgi:hypothetical protein